VLKRFEITREILFETHKKMFDKVWTWAGKKRKSDKNIGISYYKIDEEIHKLVNDYAFWKNENLEINELTAKLHHRLVWIHPFDGGNGRWSRLVTNIVYYKNKKQSVYP
jgi:fido (protein-threonine AMPylation protein)